ncbi:MAG TPA: ABC transporter permease [Streptosporangiaceae bacterium]|nr:ABC transporter permease [Streptosporangiaceae bacterium]
MSETAIAAPAPPDAGRPSGAGWRRRLSGPAGRTTTVLLVASAAVVAVAGADKPGFLSSGTLVAVAFGMSITGVLGIGLFPIVISGGQVDLSIPTSTSLAALCTAAVLPHGSALAAAAGIAAGTAVGLLNGGLIVVTKVNPIVITLGVNFAGQGFVNLVFGQRIPPPSGLRRLALSRLAGLPATWWLMLAILVVTALFMARTRPAAHAIAVGGNPVAARRQGIALGRVRVATFTFMGLCAGVAGVLYTAPAQIISPGDTTGLLFPAITAVILSGVSLQGGRGSLPVLIVAVGLLATVPPALISVGLSPNWEQFVLGALLITAVAMDGIRGKRQPG